MISTKDLSGLPNAERLKNFCKGLAALDIIMVEEEWSFIRHYTYNPAWRKGKEALASLPVSLWLRFWSGSAKQPSVSLCTSVYFTRTMEA